MFQAQYNDAHIFYEELHKLISQGQIVNGLTGLVYKNQSFIYKRIYIHVASSDVLEKTIETTIWFPNI